MLISLAAWACAWYAPKWLVRWKPNWFVAVLSIPLGIVLSVVAGVGIFVIVTPEGRGYGLGLASAFGTAFWLGATASAISAVYHRKHPHPKPEKYETYGYDPNRFK